MSMINWEDLEKAFQKQNKKVQEKLASIRKNLLNRNIDLAMEQLKEILQLAPKNIEAKNLMVYCLKEKGENRDELKTVLESVLALDDTNVLTNYNLGELYYEKKEYQKAVEHYQKAHTVFPFNAKIIYQIGLTHQKAKNFHAACESYEKAISLDPKYRKPYINACILFEKLDDHVSMIKTMGELQANFSVSSKALNVLSVLYNNFPEKNADIEKNFAQVTSIDPNNLLNIYNQAVYNYIHNDLDKSAQLFAKILADNSLKAVKTHPIRIFAEVSISLILERQNQLKNSRKHLINVTDNLHGFLTAADINNKITELQKVIMKRRTSHRTSFMVDDGDLMGVKDTMNVEGNIGENSPIANVEYSPSARDLNESEANTTQSDLKVSTLHFSKHSSKPPESKRNSAFWDKDTCFKFLEEDPTNYEALYRLCIIHIDSKEYEEAKEKLLQLLKMDPERETDPVYILLSDVSRLQKEYDMALEYLNNISNIEESPEALTAKAACEEKLGHVEDARAIYQRALMLGHEHSPLFRRYGWFLIKLGDILNGTENLIKSYQLEPKCLKTHKKLGRAYLLSEDNKIDEAFKHFNFVYDRNPEDYIGLLGLGQAFERKGDYEKALEYLKKAAEHPKSDLNCQFFLGTVYSKLRDFKKAQDIFRHVLKNDPNHVEASVEIATIFTLLKEYEKAKKYFRHAIKINPENIIANLRYGKICQVYLKDYESAMECYHRILNVDSTHYKSYYQMGLIQYEQKKPTEAHESFKNALKANSKYAPAWKAIGILLFENNKIESALKYFDKAATFDPKDVETKIYIGNCHYELQNNEMAIEVYQDVLQLEESADIHYNLANSYYMKNELEKAIEHYSASLSLNPGRGECWYNLGNAYCMKGQYDDAVHNFKKSIEIDDQNVAAFYNLGNAYLLIKDNKQAIDAFESALKLDSSNMEWKLMLAGVYLEGSQYENVHRLVREVLDKDPNSLDAMMLSVQCYEGQGEYQEALKRAKKIQLMKPNYEGIQEKITDLNEKVPV